MEAKIVEAKIKLTPDSLKVVESLMSRSGLNLQDFVNNAITMFKWAIEQTEEGRAIASVDEKNKVYRELQMDALAYAANRHKTPSPGG